MGDEAVQKKILQLEALSPEELKNKLEAKKTELKNSFINLSISGQKVIVRQIELPKLSTRDLEKALKLEAAELLSLLPNEVALEYQVLSIGSDKINGIFVALPRETLKQYYVQITNAGAVPLYITAQILSAIDTSLVGISYRVKSFSLINFSEDNKVYLALFSAGHCELLREMSYDNISEAGQEISQSLRYALSKSANKEAQALYFTGQTKDKAGLIAKLEAEFNTQSKVIDLDAQKDINPNMVRYFNINLINKDTLSLGQRRKLHRFVNIALITIFLIFIWVFTGSLKLGGQIRALKNDFDPSKKAGEYRNKIKDLQGKIKLLENEK